MYSFEAVILQKRRIRENQNLFILMTEEYGAISAWGRKKNMEGDLGSLCRVQSSRKGNINTIESLSTIWSPLQVSSWTHQDIIRYLEILRIITLISRENIPAPKFIADYRILISDFTPERRESRCIFFLYRWLKQTGVLIPPEPHDPPIFGSIYRHIDTTPLAHIFSSQKISHDIFPLLLHSIRYSLLPWNLVPSSFMHS